MRKASYVASPGFNSINNAVSAMMDLSRLRC